MPKNDNSYLSPEEQKLWDKMMRDVRALKTDKKKTNQGHNKQQADNPDNTGDANKDNNTISQHNKDQPNTPVPADLDYFDAFVADQITLDDIPDVAPTPENHKKDIQKNTAERPKTQQGMQQDASPQVDAKNLPQKTPFAPPFVVAENSPHKLAGWRAGTPKKTIQTLAKGKPAPTLDVDLHGFTLPQAFGEIRMFLTQATADGHKCVLIIHGKGRREGKDMGAIKQNLAAFLAERPEVVAFHTAHTKHGGSGACYVLLKRTK